MNKIFISQMLLCTLIFSILTACSGGSSNESEETSNSIEVFTIANSTYASRESNDVVARLSIDIELANNFAVGPRGDHEIEVDVNVATDAVTDLMGDDFSFQIYLGCEGPLTNCAGRHGVRMRHYDDVGFPSVDNKRDVGFKISNRNSDNVVIELRNYGTFTRKEIENLDNGQFKFNIALRVYKRTEPRNLISEDFYPSQDIYTEVLGAQADDAADFSGLSPYADFINVNVAYDVSPLI